MSASRDRWNGQALGRHIRGSVVAVAIPLLTLGACSSADQDHEARELERVERDRLAALVEGDVDAARSFHADAFELVAPDGRVLSLDDYLGAVDSGSLDFVTFEPLGPMDVRIAGDTAVIWYRSHLEMEAAGQRLEHKARHLDLYERRDGVWRVVREQTTAEGGLPPP